MIEPRLAYRDAALVNLAKGRAAGAAARSKAVLVKNIKTGETVLYVSISQAAKELGVSHNTIRVYIKSRKALKGLYRITIKES